MSRLKRRLLLAGAIVAFGGLAVGIAFAAIPDSNGVIQGCYDHGGNLKVVDALPRPKHWTPLPWNQQGIQGIQGVKGDQGIQGIQGIQGVQGIKGDQGIQGVKGDTGPAGVSAAYTNYGGSLQDIGEGLTQTVSSVTLPVGSDTLMGTPYVISGSDDTRFGQCFFAPGDPYTHGTAALAYVANNNPARLLVLGDANVSSGSLIVSLRCTGLDGPIKAQGAIIATQVTSIIPSS